MRRCKKVVTPEKEFWVCDASFELVKAEEDVDSGSFVIAGYASTPSLDKERDIITVDALKGDFSRFMKNAMFRNVSLQHSNIQVGYVLDSYTDSQGKMWDTHVDNEGMFAVASLRNDLQAARETRDKIRKREIDSFSIAGRALDWGFVNKPPGVARRITKMEIYEIAVAKHPKNPDAQFDMLKADAYGRIYFTDICDLPLGVTVQHDSHGFYYEHRHRKPPAL